MNNIVKFFKSNPKDLLNLVPKEREEDFYDRIREVAIENSDKGEDAPLTQKQMIDICVVLNGKTPKEDKVVEEKLESYIMGTKFGPIFLN
jgi:hypothetical protein